MDWVELDRKIGLERPWSPSSVTQRLLNKGTYNLNAFIVSLSATYHMYFDLPQLDVTYHTTRQTYGTSIPAETQEPFSNNCGLDFAECVAHLD